jgi:mersacidin/lichenicidin family type 2 lantibiotic
MAPQDIVKAWKDPSYREVLSAVDLAQLPANPAGAIELDDSQLSDVAGATTWYCFTVSVVTAGVSCFPACGSTVWDGTCNVATYGCCHE